MIDSKEVSGWISIRDRLPDDESGYNVLVVANDIISQWVKILLFNGRMWIHNGGEQYPAIVTHWQPLPSLPKAKEQGDE